MPKRALSLARPGKNRRAGYESGCFSGDGMIEDTELPLWTPDPRRVAASQMVAFRDAANARFGLSLKTYRELHAWSVANRSEFWDLVWDFTKVIGEKGARVLIDGERMPGARFFPDARINFAENLLRRRDEKTAIVFRGEDKVSRRLTWAELASLVSRMQQALAASGVKRGDRVAAMLPNLPEAVALMLAVTSLGAIFSSCSPDFGERGVLDRFGQIEPKVFVACDGYWYAGKRVEVADKLKVIAENLPTAGKVVIVPYLGEAAAVAKNLPRGVDLDAFLAPFEPKEIAFERLPFDHPIYILYSSGTTGVPKCIVHGAGGILLQHLKEHKLNCDVRPGERLFYFTTLGWMMWNWLVTGLASEAALCLYDGSPFAPDADVLFRYAEQDKINVFGTSAKFIDAVKKSGLEPKQKFDLSQMRTITSTGSPLAPESFDFVYQSIKPDVHLASMSGGTDLAACFVLGDPTSPVWKGEIQAPGLGMAVDVWSEAGAHIEGERGELVCTKAFPSMPVQFWNDAGGKKYRAAYFERFPGIWCHGDFAEWTKHGGMIIHGRSDATLNPGGVRIGTAEIYAQVEQIPEIVEAIAIGQEWDRDVRIVLFVRLKEGAALDAALTERIKKQIRAGASPRHIPAKIIAVADIPRTRSGKITELAVRDVVHGRPVKNTEALANPEALELYRDLPALRT
jgi:acetoacetyl-CoA synthetase